jgi:hypothetical protein
LEKFGNAAGEVREFCQPSLMGNSGGRSEGQNTKKNLDCEVAWQIMRFQVRVSSWGEGRRG